MLNLYYVEHDYWWLSDAIFEGVKVALEPENES